MRGDSIHHIHAYNPEKDREAVRRIWKEIGWFEEGLEEPLDIFLSSGDVMVADIEGEAECLVMTIPGSMRYLAEELPFCCVASVGTSRLARRQGLAQKTTASALARSAAHGSLVAGLGVFEQGFYNRLGFGTGSYEHWLAFDPANLRVAFEARVPKRLTDKDWEKAYECRLRRRHRHGSLNILSSRIVLAELKWKNSFGFGYFDQSGELTHCVWIGVEKALHGPYWVRWMAYKNKEEFLELLALIRNLGDQVRLIEMLEPPGIQLQDLILQPFKGRQMTKKSEFEQRANATAYWQARILDLAGCMEKTHLEDGEVSFNLILKDPIENIIPEDESWRGITGEYVVTLGKESFAEKGKSEILPTLEASVNAFTRMWLGVKPATGLAMTDDIAGPQELLEDLDRVLRLPQPHLDWDF